MRDLVRWSHLHIVRHYFPLWLEFHLEVLGDICVVLERLTIVRSGRLVGVELSDHRGLSDNPVVIFGVLREIFLFDHLLHHLDVRVRGGPGIFNLFHSDSGVHPDAISQCSKGGNNHCSVHRLFCLLIIDSSYFFFSYFTKKKEPFLIT